ncbi:MAG: hypothetical protein Q9175_000312 [Cornicularia normoerica]
MYMTPASDYCASPMSFPNVPELLSCSFDDVSTDPSPSPPVVYGSLNNQYNTYPSPTSYHYIDPQPQIVNSIEFTDLTQPQLQDRRRRRSHTQQDKESVSNMRIRRRAQNRASQRAFRERKEKHVQHLEHELEELEAKHRNLSRSYTDLDSTHAKLKQEVKQLRSELESVKSSPEGSVSEHPQSNNFFDPFSSDNNIFGSETEVRS